MDTSTYQPPRCVRCDDPIAAPARRQPNIVYPAAYYLAHDGAVICPDCWPAEQADQALIDAAARTLRRGPAHHD